METIIEIPFRLPSLNDYINLCRRNKYQANDFKTVIEDSIGLCLKQQKIKPIETPCIITFKWIEKNKKRDLDNIFSAKKFILDALQKFGILQNDNQKWVQGLKDTITINKVYEGVIVQINEF